MLKRDRRVNRIEGKPRYGQRFVEGDCVRQPVTVQRTGYTGIVRHVYRERGWQGWLFRRFVYEVIPDKPVGGSRSPLVATQEELWAGA